MKGDILDLGCNTAGIIKHLKPGMRYVGVDHRQNLIDWLYTNYADYTFYKYDLNRQELKIPLQFDTILMLAVLEHLNRPQNILSQVATYLKPGGHFVLTTPSSFGNLIHHWGAKMGLFSKEAADEHETIFEKASLLSLLEANGLSIVLFRKFLLGGNQLCVCRSRVDKF